MIGSADRKGKPVYLHFEKPNPQDIRKGSINLDINKIMQNVGGELFDYGTFKAAYDSDPRLKNMIADFNEKGIELKTKEKSSASASQADAPPGGDTVSQMAKSATDLGASL